MNQPQAMQSIRQTLAAAKSKQAKIFNALERDALPSQPKPAYTANELAAMTMTLGQVEQVEKVQEIVAQLRQLVQSVNTINVAYGLGLPNLTANEINHYLLDLDNRVRSAGYAANKMGVDEVVKKIGTVQAKQRPPITDRRAIRQGATS